MQRKTLRIAPLLALSLLSACTTIRDYFDLRRGEPDAAQPLPIAERPEVEPIDPNRFVLDSPDDTVVGVPQVVFASATDTLSDLAREYGLGYDEIVAANPEVSPWLPGDGEPVLLPTQYILPPVPKEGIVLNIASKRLFYFPKVGEGAPRYVLTFPIGIGRVGWETPLGAATIVSKAVEPSWYVPLSVRREHEELGDPLPAVVPPGPDNPLGSRVLKLSMPGYLIHGTNQPYGVGMRVSHGCVRLYPENIEFLYELVETGEPVMIVNEPYLLGSAGGEWYFESHAPLEDDVIDPQDRLAALFESAGEDFTAAMQDHARSIASTANGFAIRVSAYDTYEVFARLQRVENTVEVDADAPTLEEVREMIEEAVAEAELEREAIGAEEPPEQVAN